MAKKFPRASGYAVLAMLMVTIHLAGAWTLAEEHSMAARVVVYTVAPLGVLGGTYARARYVTNH